MPVYTRFALLIFIFLGMNATAQPVKVYSFNDFEPMLHHNNDSVYLLNFWASWCVPCVKELPAIEQIAETYKNEKLAIVLVSLDSPKQIESKLIPFIEKNQIKSKVILLNAPDFNSWIDKVSPVWGGAIPGTLIYTKNSRTFYEQSFTYDELYTIINPLIHEQ